MYVKYGFIAGLLGLGCLSFGEESNTVNRVVVTASRVETQLESTPEIMEVISRKEMDEMQPSSVGQMFEYSTGSATATGTGSGAPKRTVISLNGLPPQYTMVLVDGIPLLTEHIHTGQNIELVPPHLIERIEVLRGAAGAQYGSGAMGGVVNIITKKATDQPAGSVGVYAGSFDTVGSHLNLLLPLADGVRLSSGLNWEKSDGHPLSLPGHRTDDTGYENLTFYNRLDVDLSDQTHIFAAVNGAKNKMEWFGDWVDSEQLTLTGGIDQELTPTLDLSARMSYSEWKAEQGGELNRLTKPELFLRWDAGNGHMLMAGVDYFYNTFERKAVVAPSQQGVGVFVQDEWVVTDSVSLLAALRYDDVEGVSDAISPKLGALWVPHEQVSVRASISQGFHAPTLQELYEDGYGHRGRAYRYGNIDLKPEYSTTYEAGVEVEVVEGLTLMLNGFYTEFDDKIVFAYEGAHPTNSAIDVWRRQNVEEAVVYGVDVGALWQINEQFRFEGGCTATESKDMKTGRKLSYSPGVSAYGKVVFSDQVLDHDVTSFLGIRAGFDRQAWSWKPAQGQPSSNTDGLTTELDDYFTFDAGVTVGLTKQLETFVTVENILGEDIQNLDDVLTELDGAPFVRVGLTYDF